MGESSESLDNFKSKESVFVTRESVLAGIVSVDFVPGLVVSWNAVNDLQIPDPVE